MAFDLIIRGGTVVDGTGAPPVTADVAVDGDRLRERVAQRRAVHRGCALHLEQLVQGVRHREDGVVSVPAL